MAFRESFELDPVAARLVKDGVITVNVVFTQDGVDTWARACRRHPGLDVSPSVSMSLVDLVEIFEKHQSVKDLTKSPSSAWASESPTPSPPSKKEMVTSKRTMSPKHTGIVIPVRSGGPYERLSVMPTTQSGLEEMKLILKEQTVESCETIIKMDKLDQATVNGVQNQLPKDSLTKIDLQRGPLHCYARMVAVCNHIGNAKLVSRIRSSQKFKLPVVPNLDAWWNAATLGDKLRLLSSNNKLSVTKALAGLPDRQTRGLAELPSPFRGASENMVLSPSPQEWYSSGGEEE